ncbi:MAG: type IV pili methyl-accepting chemotaxis transducer N-terminal domain-containing protein [Methylocystaceae bacterium]|nr:type IV pili methyl-accepting chemotaxis transducer N-terminal domain-containing protein [Methylocystaceae bacterium]
MIRRCLLALTFTLLLSPDAPSAQADDSVNALKIDIAGRQRMLTQRIAKAACYIATYNDVDKHIRMLKDAIELFNQSHEALQYGDLNLGILGEDDPTVLRELQKIDEPWALLHFASRLLLDMPNYPGSDIDMVAKFNVPALQQAHQTVMVMEKAYAEEATDQSSMLAAINLAGRQRMLTQKAAKEFCLFSYGYNSEENRAELHKTINAFDQALEDLKDGNPATNIPPAPTSEIYDHLLRIKADWQKARTIFLNTVNGDDAQSADFKTIADLNETLLQQSDQIVKMLVAFDQKMLESKKDEETLKTKTKSKG